jgi:hypothetical protein
METHFLTRGSGVGVQVGVQPKLRAEKPPIV